MVSLAFKINSVCCAQSFRSANSFNDEELLLRLYPCFTSFLQAALTVSANPKHSWEAFFTSEAGDHPGDISDDSLLVNVFPHSPLKSGFGVGGVGGVWHFPSSAR